MKAAKQTTGTRVGTNHFATHGQAQAYYFNQGFSFEAFQEKLKQKEFKVGKPDVPEENLIGLDSDGRYWIKG